MHQVIVYLPLFFYPLFNLSRVYSQQLYVVKKNWGPFSPFHVSSVERKRRLHKTCSSKEAKSIDNAIFAFSIDSRRHFGKLTSKFVLEEVIFSNLWQFLHLSLKTNNNVVQQLEMICRRRIWSPSWRGGTRGTQTSLYWGWIIEYVDFESAFQYWT